MIFAERDPGARRQAASHLDQMTHRDQQDANYWCRRDHQSWLSRGGSAGLGRLPYLVHSGLLRFQRTPGRLIFAPESS
jgi:hypothetical protein